MRARKLSLTVREQLIDCIAKHYRVDMSAREIAARFVIHDVTVYQTIKLMREQGFQFPQKEKPTLMAIKMFKRKNETLSS